MDRDYASPKRTLEAWGLRPRKRFGQNFLVDPRLARRIAELLPDDAFVLEIGGGTGTLTAALNQVAREVEVIEIDRGLVQVLRERFAAPDTRVRIIDGDALELDLRAQLTAHRAPRAICGNLPYNITTPLLERAVAMADVWQCAVLMVQREYARRLGAKPGTPDYSSLTVFVAHFCEVEHCFDAGAAGFYPAPQVASSVVRLRPRARAADDDVDQTLLLWLVRAAFAHRRKTLVNSVVDALAASARLENAPLQKTIIETAVSEAGLAPAIRAERLSLSDFERLTQRLQAQGFRTPVR